MLADNYSPDSRGTGGYPTVKSMHVNSINKPNTSVEVTLKRKAAYTPSAGFSSSASESPRRKSVEEAAASSDILNYEQKLTPSKIRVLEPDQTPKGALIDSIQQNLSLEMLAERNENSQQTRRINQTLPAKKADLPAVTKFDQVAAESMTPIPKCSDDHAGNWQGEASNSREQGVVIQT